MSQLPPPCVLVKVNCVPKNSRVKGMNNTSGWPPKMIHPIGKRRMMGVWLAHPFLSLTTWATVKPVKSWSHLQPHFIKHNVCKLIISTCAAAHLYALCRLHENMLLCWHSAACNPANHLHCSVSARFSWIMMQSCRTNWGADSRNVSSKRSMLTSAYSNIMAQYQRRWCSFCRRDMTPRYSVLMYLQGFRGSDTLSSAFCLIVCLFRSSYSRLQKKSSLSSVCCNGEQISLLWSSEVHGDLPTFYEGQPIRKSWFEKADELISFIKVEYKTNVNHSEL